jgi:hypothetical protein
MCAHSIAAPGDHLINTNAIGMLREAGTRLDWLAECKGAIERLMSRDFAQATRLVFAALSRSKVA